ncbi:MAG: hypothetical protein ACYSUI_11430 [Planctomycetota bacterium]|jgi:hypothetical protein
MKRILKIFAVSCAGSVLLLAILAVVAAAAKQVAVFLRESVV